MAAGEDARPTSGNAAEPRAERLAAARALLEEIEAVVFPAAKSIPFHEQSALVRRAVTRLFNHD